MREEGVSKDRRPLLGTGKKKEGGWRRSPKEERKAHEVWPPSREEDSGWSAALGRGRGRSGQSAKKMMTRGGETSQGEKIPLSLRDIKKEAGWLTAASCGGKGKELRTEARTYNRKKGVNGENGSVQRVGKSRECEPGRSQRLARLSSLIEKERRAEK